MEDEPVSNDEEAETLAAIEEMTQEKYLCTVQEHDPENDEWLITWMDHDGREWGCWFSRRLIEEMFTDVTLN